MSRTHLLSTVAVISIMCLGFQSNAIAQTANAADAAQSTDAAAGEIIVTAQKRSESINNVPISITAQTGEQLSARGVVDIADLGKVVPGFVFTPSPFGTQVFTLRGVGLYDSGLASSPAVSVYVDEVALPYPVMTQGAMLDLERVEVLKGPQGTLFGQNNTGGAVNYIAAKPTDYFAAGGKLTVARFGRIGATGYVSGPVTSTLNARLAFQSDQGGAWQVSRTRPKDRLGDSDQLYGRLLLDWRPTDRLTVKINVNGWRDNSDTQASQIQEISPGIAGNPALSQYPDFLNSPLALQNARSADWAPDFPNRRNDSLWQTSARVDYDLTDDAQITSVTAYTNMRPDRYFDIDGSAAENLQVHNYGRLRDFSQELRISGKTGALNWLLGANYANTKTKDRLAIDTAMLSTNKPDLSLAPGGIGLPAFDGDLSTVDQRIVSTAIFGSLEYELAPRLTVQASGRYTWVNRKAVNCHIDASSTGGLNRFFEFLQGAFKGPGNVVPLNPGDCFQLDDNLNPGPFKQKLNEHNFSYRAAVNYKTGGNALLYATYSRGYKAGVISNVGAAVNQQYVGVPQERLDAFEVGLKMPLLDRKVQFNASAFYYLYHDKQLRARIADPVFGLLETLVTVPKSRIVGAEIELKAKPLDGLDLSVAGTYLESKITDDFTQSNGAAVFDQAGQSGNFRGSPFSYTPKFTMNADAQYEWAITSGAKALVGMSVTHHSRDNASLVLGGNPNKLYEIKPYTLLDLRVGIAAQDDAWSVSIWGRNVTNTYYWTTLFQGIDERHRYAGMPATYGVTLGVQLK